MNTFQQLLKNKKFVASIVVLVPLVLVTLLVPVLVRHDPLEINTQNILALPSSEYLLGTDEYGRCIACRLIAGLRPTMIVAFGGATLALVFGSILGLIAGYYGGKAGTLIMRAADVILCFPPILLAMLVVGFWGSGVANLVIVVGILYTPHFCRIANASTLKLRKQEYVESERLLGAGIARLMWKALLPNILSALIIQYSITVSSGILLESGLSFLSLGVKPPEPSWGQMIGKAKGYIATNPMYMFWPAACLSLTILATNLMGDALRDVLDPKLKERY